MRGKRSPAAAALHRAGRRGRYDAAPFEDCGIRVVDLSPALAAGSGVTFQVPGPPGPRGTIMIACACPARCPSHWRAPAPRCRRLSPSRAGSVGGDEPGRRPRGCRRGGRGGTDAAAPAPRARRLLSATYQSSAAVPLRPRALRAPALTARA